MPFVGPVVAVQYGGRRAVFFVIYLLCYNFRKAAVTDARAHSHVSGGMPVPVGSSKEKGMEASCRREGAACGVAGQEDPPRWRRNAQRRGTEGPKGRTGAMKGA